MLGRILSRRYRIINKIGEGGMAQVYKAQDTLLNRYVTVKVLRSQYAGDESFVRRFRREAQSAASLSHTNIVNIYDVGEIEEESLYYIIMEYVEGQTLKDLIRQKGMLPIEQAVDIAAQICEALSHAHANKIIHRDIKPQNILITADGRIKVTDFGIARAAAGSTLTHTDSIVGSVHYFSPEQARGSLTGEKSDLYSLGIVLYEMLTGQLPFEGESPISVALKHIQDDMPSPKELVPEIPEALNLLVMKAVRKDPDQRYPTARTLLADLNSFRLRGEVSVNPDEDFTDQSTRVMKRGKDGLPAAEQKPPLWKRKWFWPVLIGILILGLLAFGITKIYNMVSVPETEVPSVENLTLAEAGVELEEAGLRFTVIDHENNNEVPSGSVVAQDPEAGRKVVEGREIELIISLGPAMVEVPSLIGKSEREALIILESEGLGSEVEPGYSEQAEAGKVISQNPGEGHQLPEGDVVTITISQGTKPFLLRDFTGWTQEQAEDWLGIYDLKLGFVKEQHSDQFPAGQVIEQTPAAGSNVQAGDTVDIVLSKGPELQAYNITVDPGVEEGTNILVVVYDQRGAEEVFKGPYSGDVITATGYGSGEVVLYVEGSFEEEYEEIQRKEFPQ